jgi:hypothetical protein
LAGVGLKDSDDSVKLVVKSLLNKENKNGKIVFTPYLDSSFVKLGVQKNVEILNNNHSIAWTHRKTADADIYFVSNQNSAEQRIAFNFRVVGKMPEVWDPVNGEKVKPVYWDNENGNTHVVLMLEPNQSFFIVFRKKGVQDIRHRRTATKRGRIFFSNKWEIKFDANYGSPERLMVSDELKSWTMQNDSSIKYYSGTAVYNNRFVIKNKEEINSAFIRFDSICNLATVKINGISCGTLWTLPYQLDITKALKSGENKIEIEVTNTWHNRLIGDNLLSPEKRITWTTAPFRLKDKPLLSAGIIGEVKISLH